MGTRALRAIFAAVLALVIALALWLRGSSSKPAAIKPAAAVEPAGTRTPELAPVELWIVGKTAEGGPVKLRRDVKGQAGERVVLALDELHRPAQTPAPAAAQR